jgi:nucleoside-diphosphate-sugar epimerase
MRIFVTGASGFIGTAVVQELLAAGHQVTGLTRSADGARKLQASGAQARIGRLDQLNLLRQAAAESDGVIHTAFIHSLGHMSLIDRFRLFAGAVNGGVVSSFMRILQRTETRAIDALGSALIGSGRPLVVTSGVLFLPPGKLSSEADSHRTDGPSRAFSESAALSFASRGVRPVVIRLAPTVHGAGDHGLIPQIIKAARKRGTSVYIGDGTNRWPAVHRIDAARLFRLALEKGAAGARYHGVAETGIAFRDIATKIAKRLALPAASCPDTKSAKHMGILANFIGVDNPSSSQWTRQQLGWEPQGPMLLTDMDESYFAPSTPPNRDSLQQPKPVVHR